MVNLGSRALAHDRAAISLDENGRLVLRAISGQVPGLTETEEEREIERTGVRSLCLAPLGRRDSSRSR